jgi:hypothetical protein
MPPGSAARSLIAGAALLCALLAPHPTAAQDIAGPQEAACASGDAGACRVLGLMYETGQGVGRDPLRAAELYERACDGGQLAGCTDLGLLLDSGTGVNRDRGRAAELFRRACDGGEPLACDVLGDREPAPDRRAEPAQTFFKMGRVQDAATGQPLAEVLVEIPTLGFRGVTNDEGLVPFGAMELGSYSVIAERFGYDFVQGVLEVPGNAELVIFLNRLDIDDPFRAGRVEGRVSDLGGQGLSEVEVTVAGAPGLGTLTNGQGRFTLRDVEPGLVELRFDHIGYRPRTSAVIVQPGGSVQMSATLTTEAIELDPIEVSVRSRALERNGFYRREQQGFGFQLDRAALDRLNPVIVSDALRTATGVRLSRDPRNPNRVYPVSRRGSSFNAGAFSGPGGSSRCVMPIIIDGVRSPDADLNQLPPEWLEAIEVYTGVTVPAEYGGPANSCGVVLIWTQR